MLLFEFGPLITAGFTCSDYALIWFAAIFHFSRVNLVVGDVPQDTWPLQCSALPVMSADPLIMNILILLALTKIFRELLKMIADSHDVHCIICQYNMN